MLAESDYLLLLLPSTTERRGILDSAALALLKPGGTRSWQVYTSGQPLLQMVDRARGY